MNVEIFTTPTCPYCAMVKELLDKASIGYVEYNVAVDEESRQRMVQVSGQLGVPVTVFEGNVIVGFDKVALEDAIAKKKAA